MWSRIKLTCSLLDPRLRAGVQGIEIGQAINAEDHCLAIDDKLAAAISKRGLCDPREAFGPVIAATSNQAHAGFLA